MQERLCQKYAGAHTLMQLLQRTSVVVCEHDSARYAPVMSRNCYRGSDMLHRKLCPNKLFLHTTLTLHVGSIADHVMYVEADVVKPWRRKAVRC